MNGTVGGNLVDNQHLQKWVWRFVLPALIALVLSFLVWMPTALYAFGMLPEWLSDIWYESRLFVELLRLIAVCVAVTSIIVLSFMVRRSIGLWVPFVGVLAGAAALCDPRFLPGALIPELFAQFDDFDQQIQVYMCVQMAWIAMLLLVAPLAAFTVARLLNVVRLPGSDSRMVVVLLTIAWMLFAVLTRIVESVRLTRAATGHADFDSRTVDRGQDYSQTAFDFIDILTEHRAAQNLMRFESIFHFLELTFACVIVLAIWRMMAMLRPGKGRRPPIRHHSAFTTPHAHLRSRHDQSATDERPAVCAACG